MVNRVFSYSLDVAKKYQTNFSIWSLIGQIFALVIGFVVIMFILMALSDAFFDNPLFIIIYTICFVVIVILYALKVRLKMQARLMGFALDDNNNLYSAMKINNGEEFAIGGIALGNMIDIISGDSNSTLGNVTQIAGAALTMYQLNKSFEIMQNPLVISKMVENATTLTGGFVNKILKVHDIAVDNKKATIIYDYQNMKTSKISQNKKLVIYKAYNAFDDLVNVLSTKR